MKSRPIFPLMGAATRCTKKATIHVCAHINNNHALSHIFAPAETRFTARKLQPALAASNEPSPLARARALPQLAGRAATLTNVRRQRRGFFYSHSISAPVWPPSVSVSIRR